MSKKKHGWVLYGTSTKKFVGDSLLTTLCPISRARVFDTRQVAREHQCDEEVVRKVSLTLKGKAKKVIGKG